MRLFVRVSFFEGSRIEFENCRAYELKEVDKLVVIDQGHQYSYAVNNDDESIADIASKLFNGSSDDQSTEQGDFVVAYIDTWNVQKDSLQLYYYAGDVNARVSTVFRDGDYIKLIFCLDLYQEQHRRQIIQESLINQANDNLGSKQFDQQSNASDNGQDQSPEEVPITLSRQIDSSKPPSRKVAKKWQTLAANNVLTNIVIKDVGGYADISKQQLNVPFDGDAFSVMDLVLLDQDIQSEMNEDDRTITRSYTWNKVLASTEAEYYQKDSVQDDDHVDEDSKLKHVKSLISGQSSKRRAETDDDDGSTLNVSSTTQSTDMLNDVINDHNIDIDMLISLKDFSNVEVGFLLAFKTLKMNQHTCCPYWTDWRYGRVVKINSSTSVDVKLQCVRQSTSQQVPKRQSRQRKSKSSLLLAGNNPNDQLACSAADQIQSLEVNQTTTIRCLSSTIKKEACE